MGTIGVDQLLSKSVWYEHRSLENIKMLYKVSGKRDNQNQYKAKIELAMVSTTEVLTNKIPIDIGMYGTAKKPSERKSLINFSESLNVEQLNDIHRMGVSKTKQEAIKIGSGLWYSIPKWRVNKK